MSKPLSEAISPPYINREHSWLQFNIRVLDQAEAPENPLLERCSFLSIFISNLDEFVKVRLGSISNLVVSNPDYRDNKTGMDARAEMDMILSELPALYRRSGLVFKKLLRELKKEGVDILMHDTLTEAQKTKAYGVFKEEVVPFLFPLVLDSKHPLIKFENQRQYLVLSLEREGRPMFGVVSMERRMPALIQIASGQKVRLMPTEEMLYLFGDTLFPASKVKAKALVRVTRNADFVANFEDADIEFDNDFSKLIKNMVENRGNSAVVRLEMNRSSEDLKAFMIKHLGIKKNQCFTVDGCFSYKFVYSLDQYFPVEKVRKLKYPPFKGTVPANLVRGSMIDTVLRHDVFLSYPFQSMDPLIWLLEEAADDPRVTTIKITIYRLARNSRIVSALRRAAENGKDVVAVMELSARFDEESNLSYAEQLQEAGCTVLYGFENYKVHSKIISIVLRHEGRVRYITHLGTGNYNESTAKQYTDLNIITSNREIGADGVSLFSNLAISNLEETYNKLLVAPFTFKKGLLAEMDKEIEKGDKGRMVFKFNSLSDNQMIDKLVEASQKGVKIQLIVRGICCLLPGVPGLTENITVKSIVGRFLEHSRVYSFGSGAMYISSADLMTRNVNRRVEICTPVLDPGFKKEISEMLDLILRDNVKGRLLTSDGTYVKEQVKEGDIMINSQEVLLTKYARKER